MSAWFYDLDGERKGPVSLEELKQLYAAKTVGDATPVWSEGLPAPVPAGQLTLLKGATGSLAEEPGVKWLLPVGRSGLSIAAGYLGLLAPIPPVSLGALIVSGLAMRDLRKNPKLSGWGRAVFGMVMGVLFTSIYAMAFLVR